MNSVAHGAQVSVRLAAAMMAAVIAIFLLLVASTVSAAPVPSLSRTLPLVRPDYSTVGQNPGQVLPRGTVRLEIKGNLQRVTVDAFRLPASFDPGLAVYLGTDPVMECAVLQYVGVLSNVDTNGHWRLRLESSNGQAPPQLVGFSDLT